MRDVALVLLVFAFFALAAAYVRACASVVGAQAPADLDRAVDEPEVAA